MDADPDDPPPQDEEQVVVIDGDGDGEGEGRKEQAPKEIIIGQPAEDYNIQASVVFSHNYFKKNENDTATCLTCEKMNETMKDKTMIRKAVFASSQGSTSGLSSHIRTGHPGLAKQFDEQCLAVEKKRQEAKVVKSQARQKKQDNKKQLTLSFNNNKQMVIVRPEADPNLQKNWDKNVVRFVSESSSPFAIVNHIPILLKTFWPSGRFKVDIHTPETVSNHTGVQADDVRDYIFSVLDDAKKSCSVFAFTSDFWSEDDGTDYFGMTTHFIDDQFEMRKFVPYCQAMDQRHTGRNICIKLSESAAKLGLGGRNIKKVVTQDTASNNRLAMKLSRDCDEFWCVLHVAALVLKDGFSKKLRSDLTINEVLEKCQRLANYLKKSKNSRKKVKRACKLLGVSYKLVRKYCKTRWNSKFDTIESVRHLRPALQHVANNDLSGVWEEKDLVFTPYEFAVMDAAADILKQFKVFTKRLEGDLKPTIHHILPELFELRDMLEDKCQSDDLYISDFAKALLSSFDTRFPALMTGNTWASIAHYLDPRHRGTVLWEYNVMARTKQDIEKLLFEEDEDTEPPPLIQQNPRVADENENLSAMERLAKRRRVGGDIDNRTGGAGGRRNVPAQPLSDLELEFHCFERMDINKTEAEDLLGFWRKNQGKLPLLAKAFRSVGGIQASSAAAERLFSTAGRTKTKTRPNLSSQRLEDLCLIKINSDKIEDYINGAGRNIPRLKRLTDSQIVVELPWGNVEDSEEDSSAGEESSDED